MTRLRIRCRAPETPKPAEGMPGLRIMMLPTFEDAEIVSVSEDGTETPLTNVTRVVFMANVGEATRAIVTFEGVEIDVDTEAQIDPARPQGGRRYACHFCHVLEVGGPRRQPPALRIWPLPEGWTLVPRAPLTEDDAVACAECSARLVPHAACGGTGRFANDEHGQPRWCFACDMTGRELGPRPSR